MKPTFSLRSPMQFKLRTALVVVALCGIAFAVFAGVRAERSRQDRLLVGAVRLAEADGATVGVIHWSSERPREVFLYLSNGVITEDTALAVCVAKRIVLVDAGPSLPADVEECLSEQFERGHDTDGGVFWVRRQSVDKWLSALTSHWPPGS